MQCKCITASGVNKGKQCKYTAKYGDYCGHHKQCKQFTSPMVRQVARQEPKVKVARQEPKVVARQASWTEATANVKLVNDGVRRGYFHQGSNAPSVGNYHGIYKYPVLGTKNFLYTRANLNPSDVVHESDFIGSMLGYSCVSPRSYGKYGESFIEYSMYSKNRWVHLWGFWCDNVPDMKGLMDTVVRINQSLGVPARLSINHKSVYESDI